MDTKSFGLKNVLFLIPAEDNQYINFLYDYVKNRAQSFHLFNFVSYAQTYGISAAEKYVRSLVREKNIDTVFVVPFATDYQLSVKYFAGLSKTVTVIFWMFDDENYFDDYSVYYCQAGHAVITNDYFAVHAYKKLNIPAVLFFTAYPTDLYRPIVIEKDIDVSFVGDYTKGDRKHYIEYLIENGVEVKLFGKGTPGGLILREVIPEIFSRSRINLNFTKIDKLSWINKNNPLLHRVRQNKGRPIEIALTRSFCLSENSPSMDYMFEIGKESAVFNSKEELLEKVKYYLLNHSERENIALNAYQRALSDYTADIYIPRVISEAVRLANINRETHTAYLSGSFKTNAVNGLTFAMFVMLKNGKIAATLDAFSRLFAFGITPFITGFPKGALRSLKRMLAKVS